MTGSFEEMNLEARVEQSCCSDAPSGACANDRDPTNQDRDSESFLAAASACRRAASA
jgi:hypothetical protein